MEQNLRITMLLKYLEEDPGDAFSTYALALEYIKNGSDDAAFKLMEGLYLSQPDYLPNYYHFGKLLETIGETEKAIDIYNKGMKIAKEQQNHHTFNELRGALDSMDA